MAADEEFFLVGLAVLLVFLWRVLQNWARHEVARREKAAQQAENWAAWAKAQAERSPVPLDTTPDGPVPFGYKTSWLAVRCDDPERVIAALRPASRQPANWTTGLARASEDAAFVSPALDGWVLAVDGEDFWDDTEIWERLVHDLPEVQLYASHRVSEYYRWERYLDGRLARSCCYADGEVEEDVGPLTPEEVALGFDRFPQGEGGSGLEENLPNEEDVLDIAAAWGVDPRFEKKTYPPSTGWLLTW